MEKRCYPAAKAIAETVAYTSKVQPILFKLNSELNP